MLLVDPTIEFSIKPISSSFHKEAVQGSEPRSMVSQLHYAMLNSKFIFTNFLQSLFYAYSIYFYTAIKSTLNALPVSIGFMQCEHFRKKRGKKREKSVSSFVTPF